MYDILPRLSKNLRSRFFISYNKLEKYANGAYIKIRNKMVICDKDEIYASFELILLILLFEWFNRLFLDLLLSSCF